MILAKQSFQTSNLIIGLMATRAHISNLNSIREETDAYRFINAGWIFFSLF